ncbi:MULTISPECIES: hypothetical protein [Enterobacteriaceae]|uniref:hypothetical protein n=1 Tax=Enterobacter kobei TaxID=208224 RepID=UPI0018674238|nr:hypothetical protein [Enterobacter kobei]
MLTTAEQQRIQFLENETETLRNEVAMQRVLISGLLHSFFRGQSPNESAFFDVLMEEINKLPEYSVERQDFTYNIQRFIDRYR